MSPQDPRRANSGSGGHEKIPDRRICTDRDEVAEWNADAEDEGEAKWVRGLRNGDIIDIVAHAQYIAQNYYSRGCNYVGRARIEIYAVDQI